MKSVVINDNQPKEDNNDKEKEISDKEMVRAYKTLYGKWLETIKSKKAFLKQIA